MLSSEVEDPAHDQYLGLPLSAQIDVVTGAGQRDKFPLAPIFSGVVVYGCSRRRNPHVNSNHRNYHADSVERLQWIESGHYANGICGWTGDLRG